MGGAKLVVGLARVLGPERLTVVVNTGDDETFHGLHVSPDLDSVTYALAGLTNPDTGWGVAAESFRTLAALGRLGAETWFGLGDLDLATHIRRTDLLGQGLTLSEATAEITSHLGIAHTVVPMTDDPMRTIALTDEGELAFQEYFVHRGCEPRITGLRFDGADAAKPSPAFAEALVRADAIVFCPSNPLVSIGPVLAVPGVYAAIESFTGPRVAVSPIVGGQALRGPAAKLMAEFGAELSCVGVAKQYVGLCDVFVIDEVDADRAGEVQALGFQVEVCNTVMASDQDKVELGRRVLEIAGP